MFRFLVVAAAIGLSTVQAVAGGHGGGDPPAPKVEAPTAPAKVILTKPGPKLVDLKGMTLYYYERDTTRQDVDPVTASAPRAGFR